MNRVVEDISASVEQTRRPRKLGEGGVLRAIQNMKSLVRIGIIASLTSSGCAASLDAGWSYKKFEPVDEHGEMMVEEIPGEVTFQTNVKGEYLDIQVERALTVKQIKRIEEREFLYEEQGTNNLDAQFGVAGLSGLIGAGFLKLSAGESQWSDDREAYDAWGKILIGTGAAMAIYGSYIALRAIDSKEAVESHGKQSTRIRDEIVSEVQKTVRGRFPIFLQIGDRHFPLGETDENGHLRLRLAELGKIIPRDALAWILRREIDASAEGSSIVIKKLDDQILIARELEEDAQKQTLFLQLTDAGKKQQIGFFELADRFMKQYPQSSACIRRIYEIRGELINKTPLQIYTLKGRVPMRGSTQSFYTTGDYFETGETIYVTPWQSIISPDSKWHGQYFAVAFTPDASKKGRVWMEDVFQTGIPEPPSRPSAGPSGNFDVGASILWDMAVASAPTVGALIDGIVVAVEKITRDSGGGQVSTTISGNGEIQVNTGSTGYLGLPCTDDGMAVQAGSRETLKCTTFGGPVCVIPNLTPGKYAVSARRSGGCKIKEIGPIEVTVESGKRVKVDFSGKFAP